jgi:starvation-inducible DNA-binding protein
MLSDSLKIALASSYVFQIKVQNFHWNVEGPNFPQYHKFLDDLYSEINENAIDQTAELCRQLDVYAPGSITRFAELSIIQDQVKIPRAELMMAELNEDNMRLLAMWKEMFTIAEQENEQGICDFIASRIDAHGKHGWMLRSILKSNRA